MAIPVYLAMTAGEMEKAEALPESVGWMACHFSLSYRGMTNFPRWLPEGSLLMLDDATPVADHDPVLVAQQLEEAVQMFSCIGILLDFQRPGMEQTAAMAAQLCQRFPGRVTISAAYAGELSCPVCLPPAPCGVPLPEYLAPWKGREIWLECALTKENWNVTREGARRQELFGEPLPEWGFQEETLHCHYAVALGEDCVRFTLWRNQEDFACLRAEAERCGVKAMVGLWQELG